MEGTSQHSVDEHVYSTLAEVFKKEEKEAHLTNPYNMFTQEQDPGYPALRPGNDGFIVQLSPHTKLTHTDEINSQRLRNHA